MTEARKTLVFGATELYADKKCLAGRGILRIIPNASEQVLKRVFQACVWLALSLLKVGSEPPSGLTSGQRINL